MRVFEDILDDAGSVKATVPDENPGQFNPKCIDPDVYIHKAVFVIVCPVHYDVIPPGIKGTAAILDEICKRVSIFLDNMRQIRAHSDVLVFKTGEPVEGCERCFSRDSSFEGDTCITVEFAFTSSFKNIKWIFAFISGLYSICNWQGKAISSSDFSYIRFRLKKSMDSVWRDLMTITADSMIIACLVQAGLRDNISKQVIYYYRNLCNFCGFLFNGTAYEKDCQFIEYTKMDQVSELFQSAFNYMMRKGASEKKLIKNIKCNSTTRELLQSIVFDAETLEKIKDYSYIQTNRYFDTSSTLQFALNSKGTLVHDELEYLKKFLAEKPVRCDRFVFKTFFGGIEWALVAYLGLFDYDEVTGIRNTAPKQIMLIVKGDVDYPEVKKKFSALTGRDFDDADDFDIYDNIVAPMLDNSNS